MGEMSTLLASGAEGGALLPTGAPLALSSHLLPQAQGSLPPASFQEGRRASDTSLTQGTGIKNSLCNLISIFLTSVSRYTIKGLLCNTFPCLSAGLKAFRQQLRKNTRTKGLLGLNKIKGLTRQVIPPPSCNRGSRGSLGPALSEHRSMLEEVLHQQRWDMLVDEYTLLLNSTYEARKSSDFENPLQSLILFSIFQDAADPAPAPASGQSCSDRTYPESLALSDPATVILSSTYYSFCFLLHLWHSHSLCPSSSTSFSGSTTQPLATKPRDFLIRFLLILLILLRLISVSRSLCCLPSRGSSAHQSATPPSPQLQPSAAASVCNTRHLPHPV